jgi:hypothetical protein
MRHLGRILWLIPFAAQIGYLLATSDDLPRLVGGSPGDPGTRLSLFVAEWFAVIGLANAAFVFVHLRLPTFSDRMLSVPGKEHWLSTPQTRAVLVERLRGVCESALLMLNVFFLAVYQSIYQTNASRPVITVPEKILIPCFMALPVAVILASVLLAMRSLAREARKHSGA